MTISTVLALTILIGGAALLYSTVGHAGASAYLAAMALFGLAPGVMKPTALALNIIVAAIAAVKFYRAGCFSWSLFWPFAATSIPLAFIGGGLTLPGTAYKVVVGLVLLYSASRLFRFSRVNPVAESRPFSIWLALILGAGIGFLSGLVGVGGGIFLSPLLLFMGWADVRHTSGVASAFILVNSIAGLLGHLSSFAFLPPAIPIWAAAAVVGGWIGAEYGSRRFGNATLRRLLAVVLVIAGLKLILT